MDLNQKLEAARARLPLWRLMEQRDRRPSNGNWKKFPKCPYCDKDGAGIFQDQIFKCWHTSCRSGTAAKGWDEIGFLAFELGLSRSEAWRVWLQEAGVWEEKAESRKQKAEIEEPEVPPEPVAEPEERLEDLPPLEAPANDLPSGPPLPGSSEEVATSPAASPPVGAALAEGGSSQGDTPAAALAGPPPGSGAADPLPAAAGAPGVTEPAQGLEPAPPDDSQPEAEEASPGLRALRWFYRRLHLSDADRRRLWERRGLTAATVAALGFRSNPASNREVLQAMAAEFPPGVLVASGLWSESRKPGEPAKPNAQFCGMSLVPRRDARGKKVRDGRGQDVLDPMWDEPILIPYFDAAGELVHLRPHKGMMREKSARFYVVRPAGGRSEGAKADVALICEGEFKAGAPWQVLNPEPGVTGIRVAVGSLPGISMAKQLLPDIEDWLAGLGVRQVVVAYDSEEKGDPALPGYHPDPWRRFDAQKWARYLAWVLGKAGYEGRVAVLPKAWRDAKGKADWDGALAARLQGRSEAAVSPREWAAIREEWLGVVKAALRPFEVWQAGWFTEAEERIIEAGFKRLQHEPKLPYGKEREAAEVKRLQRVAARRNGASESLTPKQRGFLHALAAGYRSVEGRYYVLKALSEGNQAKWQELGKKAAGDSDVELRRACESALKGIPEAVSDFYLEPLYVLRRTMGGKEHRERLVRVRNVHGMVTEPVRLDKTAFAQPTRFREWLLQVSPGAAWSTGERPLQWLHEDFSARLSFKDVTEVPVRLYDEESGCWFFEDATYDAEGVAHAARELGIVWVGGKAYRLGPTDHEGQSFRHGEPRLGERTAVGVCTKLYGEAWRAEPGEGRTEEWRAMRFLFQDISRRFFEVVGDYGGWLAMGMCFLTAAGPELFERYSAMPGLWVHGEPRQGKSSLARWLMRFFGLRVENGIPLKDSTRVGLGIAAQQYGYGFDWLEEYQANPPDWMIEKLKSFYDRGAGSKKTFEEGDRKMRAMALVTGVATSSDAQLRSRFAHVQVSSVKRLGNHFDWMQRHSREFPVFGRYLMEHRKEFAARVLGKVQEWLESPAMAEIKDERARLVHGAGYAGFWAMVSLLESHGAEELTGFRNHLLQHSREAVAEVNEAVNVNQFWQDLLDATKSDAFGQTVADRLRIFKVVENPTPRVKLTEFQVKAGAEDRHKAWGSVLLYFQPGPVIAQLREWKRHSGRELPLDRNDLRAQMRTRKYWVEPAGSRAGKTTHRQRFSGQTSEDCWCIDLDFHELGLRPVSDEEFVASQMKDPEKGEFFPSSEWIDPRRGDLFALVDELKQRKQEEH